MSNIDYGKELQNAYDEGYAKAKSEIKSIWHITSNYDDRPQIPENENCVKCLLDFGNGNVEVATYNFYKNDSYWRTQTNTFDFWVHDRWAYLSDIVKL